MALPVLFDLADGIEHPEVQDGQSVMVKVGTPIPNGMELVQTQSSGANPNQDVTDYPVEEEVDSPLIERAEQATITKRFNMGWEDGKDEIAGLGRGTVLQDSWGNVVRVLSSTLQRLRGGRAALTVVSESLSFDTPPDEFSVSTVELGINILKHPRYFYALAPNDTDSVVEYYTKHAIIRGIQEYQDNPLVPPTSAALGGLINGQIQSKFVASIVNGVMQIDIPNPNFEPKYKKVDDATIKDGTASPPAYTVKATADGQINDPSCHVAIDSTSINSDRIILALAAAKEILGKIWRIEDNPYLVGFQITWSAYYYRPPYLSPGGYIQDPINDQGVDNPGLPDYFYSPSTPPQTDTTIFDDMPIFNPCCYSSDGTSTGTVSISWLRKADDIEYQRTWFKVTRTWIGSAIGCWDTDIFSHNNRPTVPADYRGLGQ